MNIFKPEDPRKPHSSYEVLPKEVADLLYEHARSATIYCPSTRPEDLEEKRDRAANIRNDYRALCNSPLRRKRKAPMKILAEKYQLSRRQIYNIINNPNYLLPKGERNLPEI